MTFKKSDLEVTDEIEIEEPTTKREYKDYVLQRYDPHGFIYISHLNKPGPLPEDLKGTFTNFTAAIQTIDSYLNKLTTSLKNKPKVA